MNAKFQSPEFTPAIKVLNLNSSFSSNGDRDMIGEIMIPNSCSLVQIEDLFIVQLCSGVSHSLFDSFLSSLQELLFLELQLLLHLFSLHVWNEERGNEILNEHLWFILLGLNLIDELVEGLRLKLGLVVGLE